MFNTVIDNENQEESCEKEVSPSDDQGKVQALEEKVETLKEKVDYLVRAVADEKNATRRMENEKNDMAKYAVFSLVKDLVTVADNLESALGSVPKDQAIDDALMQGVSMTLGHLHTVFKRFHVEKVKVNVGDAPDPTYCQVIEKKAHSTVSSNMISHILQDGYCLHERLIRPALVNVSSGPESEQG